MPCLRVGRLAAATLAALAHGLPQCDDTDGWTNRYGATCAAYLLDGHCDGSGACAKVADCVAEEAAGVLLDLVAARAPALLTDGVGVLVLALDSAHGGSKFSRHLLLQAPGLRAEYSCVSQP